MSLGLEEGDSIMLGKRVTLPRVYMAGKMVLRNGGGGDNKIPGRSYRPFDVMAEDMSDESRKTLIERRQLCGVPFLYCGPWQARGSYHGLIHGITDCGSVEEADILARALDGIEKCDIFFALLDGLDCHGTLVEIGYAKAREKPVIVGVVGDTGDDPRHYSEALFPKELWFAIHMADIRLYGSHASLLRQLSSVLALPTHKLTPRLAIANVLETVNK